MKLNKPITITIETVEEAVHLWHRTNTGILENGMANSLPNWILPIINFHNGKPWKQIDTALKAAGIDPHQAPPQPLKIASHEVTANPDGSIKVGCTAVTRAEIEAAYKLSTEAMQQEPEWPKFVRHGNDVLEFHKDNTDSIWHDADGTKESIRAFSSYQDAINGGYKPLTAIEAARILEGKQ